MSKTVEQLTNEAMVRWAKDAQLKAKAKRYATTARNRIIRRIKFRRQCSAFRADEVLEAIDLLEWFDDRYADLLDTF